MILGGWVFLMSEVTLYTRLCPELRSIVHQRGRGAGWKGCPRGGSTKRPLRFDRQRGLCVSRSRARCNLDAGVSVCIPRQSPGREGQSQFSLTAAVFKSQTRPGERSQSELPPPAVWRRQGGIRLVHGYLAHQKHPPP